MTFKIYKDQKGEWRWRLVARNGRIVADSAEGYKRRHKCERTLRRIIDVIYTAKFAIE